MSRPGGDRLRVTVYDMFGESPQMLEMSGVLLIIKLVVTR